MTVRPRGNSFEAAVCVKGKRLRRSFQTKDEAEAWTLETKAAVIRGGPVDLPKPRRRRNSRTMADLLEATYDRYWCGAKAEQTLRTNAEHVVQVLGADTFPWDVTECDIDVMIRAFTKRGNSNATVNR